MASSSTCRPEPSQATPIEGIAYLERRRAEGLSKPDIIGSLKRYMTREVFTDITRITQAHQPDDIDVIAA